MPLGHDSAPEQQTTAPLALITGGAVRLGREIAHSLAAEGYRLAIHHHSSTAKAEQSAASLAESGVTVTTHRADLTTDEGCRELVESVAAQNGPIDVLVNNAALFEPGSLQHTDADSWNRQMQLNLRAPFLLSHYVADQIPGDRAGSVLNILDARLRRPAGDYLAYRLTKAGLLHLTQCLAVELAPGIRVNGLAPGAILPHAGETAEEMQQRLGASVPLPLKGGAQSLGRCAVELITNPFLTGQIIYLDGGQFL